MIIGISISDFLTLGSLIKKIYDAISESHGASDDFQALACSLSSLTTSLNGVYRHFLHVQSASNSRQTPSSLAMSEAGQRSIWNGLQVEFTRCHKILQQMLILMQRYVGSLSTSNVGGRISKTKEQLRWTLSTSGEVKKKLATLDPQLKAFELYCAALDRTLLSAPDHQRYCEALRTLEQIPRDLGYPGWTADIRIEDGLGDRFSLPVELCLTSEVGSSQFVVHTDPDRPFAILWQSNIDNYQGERGFNGVTTMFLTILEPCYERILIGKKASKKVQS